MTQGERFDDGVSMRAALRSLDPDLDPLARERFAAAIAARIEGRRLVLVPEDPLYGLWSLPRPLLVAASIIAVAILGIASRPKTAAADAPSTIAESIGSSIAVTRYRSRASMITSLTRARIYGALLALVAFALGLGAGMWYRGRLQPGINITVTATDHMPRELQRLDLTAAEHASISAALRRGRDRVLRARSQIDTLIGAAVDSTDEEIRALLTDTQRASFDSARRANGPRLQRKELIIHR